MQRLPGKLSSKTNPVLLPSPFRPLESDPGAGRRFVFPMYFLMPIEREDTPCILRILSSSRSQLPASPQILFRSEFSRGILRPSRSELLLNPFPLAPSIITWCNYRFSFKLVFTFSRDSGYETSESRKRRLSLRVTRVSRGTLRPSRSNP
jgi:hypothetical protein